MQRAQAGRRFASESSPPAAIGIDTPEVYFGVECGGRKASASMERMIQPGDRVKLIRVRTQANRDRYDRLLRYVELGGRDLGRKQVRKGWASVYVYDEPFRRLGLYRDAARKARKADRGVWGPVRRVLSASEPSARPVWRS